MARRGRDEPADLAERDDPAADPVAVAREIVLRSLTVRARSRAELVETLRKRGVPDAAASACMAVIPGTISTVTSGTRVRTDAAR